MLSGPIRRGKTFFMGGYQGFYENIPFPVTRTVPTAAQLRGDFSQTTTANGTPILIYDPATTACNANFSSCTRQPFPATSFLRTAGIRSRGRCCRTSRRPNATPSNLSGASNFISSPNIGRYRYNSYLTRIDHVFSNNHRLSVSNSGNWGIEFRNENALPEPAIRSDNYPTHRNHYLVTVDDNHTINASTLWNTRVSWDRFDEPHDKVYGDIDPQLPFTGPYQLTGPPFPEINPTGYEGMFPRTFRQPKNDAYSVNSDVSKTMGRHFLEGRRRVPRLSVLPLQTRSTRTASSLQQRLHPSRSADNTGAASGNGVRHVPARPADQRQRDTGTPRTEQYRYYAIFAAGRLEDRLPR